MKIYHVELATSGELSGGETCMVEVIKYLQNKGVPNILLTTTIGYELYEGLGLHENEFLRYVIVKTGSRQLGNVSVFFSYIFRVLSFMQMKKYIVKDINRDADVLMCHNDFFPNTIPTKILSKRFAKRPLYWFHMLCPSIFKGYKGYFLNTFHIPSIALVHFRINQLLFRILLGNSTIIYYNPYYEKLFPNNPKYFVNLGASAPAQITSQKRTDFDIAYMSRFHEQKGLFEIPEILKLLKQEKDDIKLLLIGGGKNRVVKRFFKIIDKEQLSENIEYVGPVTSDKKFEYLMKAKVFIFPSYYESFGIVIREAMMCGLPVAVYDLPVFVVHERGIVKVPIRNNEKFSKEIIRMLDDRGYYEALRNSAVSYSSMYTWKRTGKEIYDLILRMGGFVLCLSTFTTIIKIASNIKQEFILK